MTDRKGVPDANEPPEDVASLYSWANLHGAKYRDFSAARAQSREQSRQRAQAQNEKEPERPPQQPERRRVDDRRVDERQVEEGRRIVQAKRSEEQENLADLANQLAAQLAAQQASELAAQQGGPRPPRPDSFPAPTGYPTPPSGYPAYPTPRTTRPVPASAPLRQDLPLQNPYPELRTTGEPRDIPARPAWLAENPDPIPPPNVPRAPEDTIQGSRDRLTSRWYALKAVFEGAAPSPIAETAPVPASVRPPVMAVFSLAGGVGKTSLVATLGRALSARGERVLLVDTAAFGLLPFFFGARDQRPGLLRTFNPPLASGDSPIQLIAIDPEGLGAETVALDALGNEILKHTQGVSRIIVDLATASGATTRRILKLSPLVLVPMIPDMNSVVSVGSIDAFFEHNMGAAGGLPYYVLNQFDPSLPLHLDVREVLREQLNERLLTFALRRAPAISEALAEGMTVMDYAPNSTVAEDFSSLAGWVKTISAPAGGGFRGVRWSER